MKRCPYCGFYGEPYQERDKKKVNLFCARCGNQIDKTGKKKRKEVRNGEK